MMTIPNLITGLRIILVPIFIICLINGRFLSAIVVFILAGLSDGADGFIARVFNQKSKLGAYLDPLADKILLVSAFIALAVRHFVPPWLTVVVISRDVLILLGVLILFLNGANFTIKPSIVSKLTTCFQLITVLAILFKEHLQCEFQAGIYLYWLTGLLTIASGLHYMRTWFLMIAESALGE